MLDTGRDHRRGAGAAAGERSTKRRAWWVFCLALPAAACGPSLQLDGDDDPFRPVTGDGGLPAAPDDGGPRDAGLPVGPPADAGAPDAGFDAGPMGAPEGEACSPAINPCAPGLYCLPDLEGGEGATCVKDCGFTEGAMIFETPEVCGMYEACNTLLDETASFALAAVCLPIEYARDRACYALDDPDVCALDRECVPSEVSQGVDAETNIDALLCRDTCTLGAPDADEQCSFEDVCLPDGITTKIEEPELTDPGDISSIIPCEPEGCAGDAEDCPCSLDEGYRCADVAATPRCARIRGLCGTPAPYLAEGDPVTFDDLCNEIRASRFCDRRPYLDLGEDAALPMCIPLSMPPVEGDGICIGFCHQPAFDYNGDGNTDFIGSEREIDLLCPEGLVCETGFARSVGLVSTGGSQLPCDPAECPVGEPCGSCPGQVECVDEDYLAFPTCAAVFGTCQPPPPPEPDGGPADAGLVEAGALDGGALDGGALDAGALDAGALDAGAGDTGPVDAGVPFDAGGDPLDAG